MNETQTARDKILKTVGDFTSTELINKLEMSRALINKEIKNLKEEGKIFYVTEKYTGSHPSKVYNTIEREYKQADKPPRTKRAPKEAIVYSPIDLFSGIIANLESIDRFYRGTQCGSRG